MKRQPRQHKHGWPSASKRIVRYSEVKRKMNGKWRGLGEMRIILHAMLEWSQTRIAPKDSKKEEN